MNLFHKKTFEEVREVSSSSGLSKSLTAFDLIIIGLGAIIGTGVFVLTGSIAAQYSGPAVMVSYAIPGLVCIFVALAYSELSVMLPTSGSIYTYSYVAFGEIFAWIMVSILLLEITFGAATVAAAWGAYVVPIVEMAGFNIPLEFTKVPSEGGIINLPAILIIAFVTLMLYLGTKDSKKLNTILVFVKFAAISAFVIAAIPNFNVDNWTPFMPFGTDELLVGASVLFFAFNGFTIIPTAAEECKNPKRDIIIGIVGALLITTFVYILIGGLLTGIVSYTQLNNAQPLAYALTLNKSNIGSMIVSIGAICGMTTVLMMNIFGTSRIAYSIARDGLLPKSFTKIHPKYDTPYIALIFIAILTGLLSAFFPCMQLAKLTSMGALIDYIVVIAILVLFRVTKPDVERTFKCPAIYIIAPAAFLSCIYLLFKQVLDKDNNLSEEGKYLIMWIIGVTLLYFPMKFFIGAKRNNADTIQKNL